MKRPYYVLSQQNGNHITGPFTRDEVIKKKKAGEFSGICHVAKENDNLWIPMERFCSHNRNIKLAITVAIPLIALTSLLFLKTSARTHHDEPLPVEPALNNSNPDKLTAVEPASNNSNLDKLTEIPQDEDFLIEAEAAVSLSAPGGWPSNKVMSKVFSDAMGALKRRDYKGAQRGFTKITMTVFVDEGEFEEKAKAYYMLGVMYRYGLGERENTRMAIESFGNAARGGLVYAWRQLAELGTEEGISAETIYGSYKIGSLLGDDVARRRGEHFAVEKRNEIRSFVWLDEDAEKMKTKILNRSTLMSSEIEKAKKAGLVK